MGRGGGYLSMPPPIVAQVKRFERLVVVLMLYIYFSVSRVSEIV